VRSPELPREHAAPPSYTRPIYPPAHRPGSAPWGARRADQQALALAEQLGIRPLQAHCHLGLGKLYRRTGRLDEARAELATAVEMLREMGMAFWLPEAEGELAEVSL
jgi:hypothetical protein